MTYDVPFRSVGTVHRAKNTPTIMHSEIMTGEKPALTSLVGASAPPNHVEAAIAQKTPSPCIDRVAGAVLIEGKMAPYGTHATVRFFMASVKSIAWRGAKPNNKIYGDNLSKRSKSLRALE
jgi:hypothetical protein